MQVAVEIVKDIVEKTLKEIEPSYKGQEDYVIFGKEGKLDSLGLVSFIFELEAKIEEELDLGISIVTADAMSKSKSPFKIVDRLSQYIWELVTK